MPGFIINQDRANHSVGNGVKPVNKISTYENLDKNVGPTALYDSSLARNNAIRRRINSKAKRAQVFVLIIKLNKLVVCVMIHKIIHSL